MQTFVDFKSRMDIMKKKDVKSFLKRIAQSERIVLSKHCRRRMAQRGISAEDIMNALFWGDVTDVKHDPGYSEWHVEVTGADLEGDELSFHGAFYDLDDDVLCITVY